MSDDSKRPHDEAVEKELEGVPQDLRDESDDGESGIEDALAALRGDLDAAKQEVLYARAETQNVRRRLEVLYGKTAKLRCERRIPHGFLATIEIPLETA